MFSVPRGGTLTEIGFENLCAVLDPRLRLTLNPF